MKLNQPGTRAGRGPLATETVSSVKTHEDGTGYQRDERSQLFLLATTTFAGEGSFYESAAVSDERLKTLTRTLAITTDGWTWLCGFLPWLRSDGSIRTASLICAAEAVAARIAERKRLLRGEPATGSYEILDTQGPPLTHRQLIAVVCQRADEPCEMLAYALGVWGRALPLPVKRGIADAAVRLWNEAAALRWDKPGNAVRFADVLELCHPRTGADWQNVMFRDLITERKGRDDYEPDRLLRKVRARWLLNQQQPAGRHAIARHALDGDMQDRKLIDDAAVGQWEWTRSWLGER
jgi:hypothetical protein